jgi:formylglycine-generating enzyme required for sulfatase activity
MVGIPSGKFLMGSPAKESGRFDAEGPQHEVAVKAFALGKYPVTSDEFLAFLKESGYQPEPCNPTLDMGWRSPGGGRADPPYQGDLPRWPAVCLDWRDANKYIDWLNAKAAASRRQAARATGPYRLPTEAEWECACRAGADTSHYYGSGQDLLPRYAWHLQNASGRSWPVGQKKPNDLGLFDMHGNVWNWCQEAYAPYQPGRAGKPSEDEEDRKEITDQADRVLRGGSFIRPPPFERSAGRNFDRPSVRYYANGLRLARTWR